MPFRPSFLELKWHHVTCGDRITVSFWGLTTLYAVPGWGDKGHLRFRPGFLSYTDVDRQIDLWTRISREARDLQFKNVVFCGAGREGGVVCFGAQSGGGSGVAASWGRWGGATVLAGRRWGGDDRAARS